MMKHPTDWDSLLPMIQFAHNNAVTASTKYSPFYLHLGRSPRLPTLVTAWQTVSTRSEEHQQHLADVYHEVFENMDEQYSRIEKYANQSRREKLSQFPIGQLVKLRILGRLAKYATPFCGPFKILDIQPTGAIKLDLLAGSRISPWINVEHIEPFSSNQDISPNNDDTTLSTDTQNQVVDQYILRDWNTIPPRYWVRWKGLEGTNRESFVAEQQAPGGVQAILDWEFQHGPIPELNITRGTTSQHRGQHREKVSQHKYKVYHQYFPVLHDTWTDEHPMKTFTLTGRHRSIRPSQPNVLDPQENLLDRIVCKRFVDETDQERWYKGKVIDFTNEGYKIRYEPGDVEYLSPQELVSLLQDTQKIFQTRTPGL